MVVLSFFIYFLLNLTALLYFRKSLVLNPSVGFIFFNFLTGIGIFILVDFSIKSNEIYVYLTLLCTFFFIIGSVVGFEFFSNRKRLALFYRKERFFTKKDTNIGFFFFFLSVAITIVYYQLLGYNLTLTALSGDFSNFTDLRLESYNGENYLASGYVNQFKNTLLPISFIFIFLTLNNNKTKSLFILIFLPIVFYGLLGNGQRTFLAMFVLLNIFSYMGLSGKALSMRMILWFLLPFLFIFGYLSFALGRVEGFSFLESINALVFRIFASNQMGAITGFDYVYNIEGVKFLQEWLDGLKGFLPGYSGSKIAFIIHGILYGSERGTAPLGIWGSFYYNLGFFGSLVFSFLLGFTYQFFYKIILAGKNNLFRVVLFSSMVMYLSVWFSGAPDQMINNGILAVVMLLVIRKFSFKF